MRWFAQVFIIMVGVLGAAQARADVGLSGEVGVDVGATFRTEGARQDVVGISSLLLGAELDGARWSLSAAIGVPIMPSFSIQAPVRLRWHSGSPRNNGWFGVLGLRPIVWGLANVCANDPDPCPVTRPGEGGERPQRVYGLLGGAGLGAQWAPGAWGALRAELTYQAGPFKGTTSSLGPALSGLYQGFAVTLSVVVW